MIGLAKLPRKIAGILEIRAKPAPNRSFMAQEAEYRAGRLGRKSRAGFKTRYFGTDTNYSCPSELARPANAICIATRGLYPWLAMVCR